jgi:dihydrolipoamide dehydrogenase
VSRIAPTSGYTGASRQCYTRRVATETLSVDAVVIGAGPGGYVAGIRLGQLKKKALVVEKDKPGGICLNVGCIPSKALINAAKLYDKLRHGDEIGIFAENLRVDMGRMQRWKEEVVGKLTGGVRALLKANGCDYRTGVAHLTGRNTVHIEGQGADAGKTITVEARAVVVATGSRPVEIPGFAFDGNRVVDSTGALAFAEVPGRLVVIGAGYIGMEIGTLYAKLGSKVAVVEALSSILPGTDPDLVAVVARRLKKMGVETITAARARSWAERGDRATVTVDTQGGEVQLDADRILVAVGRRPNSEGLGLEALGVRIEKGFIPVDRRQQTNVPGIYAIGDVVGQPMLAHKASREAEVVAEVIAGRRSEMDVRAIPAVIFTDPEVATVGVSAEEATRGGRTVRVGKFPFAALGRAIANHDTDGLVKVIVDAQSSEVLGLEVVGNGAGDIIAEAALAIEMGALADDLGLTVHAHPTLPEAIMEAAKASHGEAIHIQNRAQ